jgi:hypothetical protein
MPASGAAIRDYIVSIESRSGSVSGNLIHGRATSVLSNSGSLTLQLNLFGAGRDSSTLSTSSESGSSKITLVAPTSSSITQLVSTHTTKDGSLSLRYPIEWEGIIEGHTKYGKIRLDGKDIELIQQSPQYILARKGRGNSKLSFSTTDGSASIVFG